MSNNFYSQTIGWVLIIIGIILGFVGFVGIMLFMDANNPNSPPAILFVMVIGGLALGLVGRNTFKSKKINNQTSINEDTTQKESKFNGEKNLDDDRYQLYLVEKYDIKKNETLNKYVFKGQPYKELKEALEKAHELDLK